MNQSRGNCHKKISRYIILYAGRLEEVANKKNIIKKKKFQWLNKTGLKDGVKALIMAAQKTCSQGKSSTFT